MIYLDNAATTNYKPQKVIDAVVSCLTKFPFNPNRGNNPQTMQLQQKLLETRKKLYLLYNGESAMHVAFTGGCTQALNLAILGNARRGNVIVSSLEHNSVLRPVMQLQKRGYVTVSVAHPDENGQVTLQEIQKLWQKDTFLVCLTHASNVTGARQNLTEIGGFVRRNNGIFLVDCAQSTGYFTLDMQKECVDLVAIGAHKGLHAMQGAGALIFNSRATPRPTVFGGTGTESNLCYQPATIPDGLESGTLPTPAIMSMNAGIDWWLENWKENDRTVQEMQTLLWHNLQQIPNVHLYSQQNKSGIVAFNVGDADSNFVADELARYDIAVRGGLQCAPLMHQHLCTFRQGVVRASVSCVTTRQECFALLNAVDNLSQKLARQ